MSILEWVLIVLVIGFFLAVFFFATIDLFRDRKYYKQKQKNVSNFQSNKKNRKR